MTATPAILIHLSAALAALLLGPWVLWTRWGSTPRPRLHRALGYAWVTLMVLAALSSLFIHSGGRYTLGGYSLIHLIFVPLVSWGLVNAFRQLARGNIAGHRAAVQGMYWQACVVAGAFTLLPQRYLGHLIWGDWLGWL